MHIKTTHNQIIQIGDQVIYKRYSKMFIARVIDFEFDAANIAYLHLDTGITVNEYDVIRTDQEYEV